MAFRECNDEYYTVNMKIKPNKMIFTFVSFYD